MRKTKWFALITALSLTLGFSAKADLPDGNETSGQTEADQGSGKEEKPETPEPPADDPGDVSAEHPGHPAHPEHSEKPERPDKPEQAGKSDGMKQILADFRSKLTELNTQRHDLRKQLKDATEDERATLRESLEANREDIAKLKEEFRDEVRELHETLKNHGAKLDAEAVAEAKAAATGRSRE